jgi:hypothetical protein
VDLVYWESVARQKSAARAKAMAQKQKAAQAEVGPLLVDEAEPDAIHGANDSTADAELIPEFGSAAGKRPKARILGTLAVPPTSAFSKAPEDNGSIPLAGATGLTAGVAVRTTDIIGDGPHGSGGTGRPDFDFYKIPGARAGQSFFADVDTPTGNLVPGLLLWDAAGNAIADNDGSDDPDLDPFLKVTLPADGDYFLTVADVGMMPSDPFDSGSGDVAASEGPYTVTLGLGATDIDFYAVDLRAGDVLSGSVAGAGTRLQVFDPAGREVFGSTTDLSFLYPAASPLTGGGNATVDHVAGSTGRHYVAVSAVAGSTGNYDVKLEVYRSDTLRRGTQTIFLDFDGARVDTSIFGGPGIRTLSPLSAFLDRWGIPASQTNAVIDRVVATVTENLRFESDEPNRGALRDFAGRNTQVRILNSRDHADPFGQPNVSRVIIGGTIAESGIETISISESIDPGNFETAETALILLDALSGAVQDWGDATFNSHITPASDKVRFVGTALGDIASHEAGHYLGNYDVNDHNDELNLMDKLLSGVCDACEQPYGIGPDGVGGTADDPDLGFGEDSLIGALRGLENTRTRTRWALTRPADPLT